MKRKFLVVLMLLLLWGCDTSQSTQTTQQTTLNGKVTLETVTVNFADGLSYDDFTHIANADWQLVIDHESYYIYFYQTTCTACQSIKDELLEGVAALNSDIVYFVEIQEVSDVNEAFAFDYIPTIVHIVNGEIVSEDTGASSVLNVLEGLE